MSVQFGICPVCNGTCRVPVPANLQRYKDMMSGYDKVTDTFECKNCGGQYMYGRATGEVPIRSDGTPCTHCYQSTNIGRCLTRYTCRHCASRYDIDSGD